MSLSQSALQQFKTLSNPVKWWSLTHPFVLKKVRIATQETLRAEDSLYQTNELDQFRNGGKIDAFRHGYWMALLTRSIGSRKALSLGRAHERGNRKDFKRKKLEEGLLPDSVSIAMDLHNNRIGSEIAQRIPTVNQLKLQEAIIHSIKKELLFTIIKRNAAGDFLDSTGRVILPERWQGKWNNERCLVPSSFEYP